MTDHRAPRKDQVPNHQSVGELWFQSLATDTIAIANQSIQARDITLQFPQVSFGLAPLLIRYRAGL